MKWVILLGMVFLAGCTTTLEPEPVACTLDAKKCPDGSFVGRIPPDCEFEACPKDTGGPPTPPKQHYCEPGQRNVGACIEIYDPVCGWNDARKIQCIKYPCAQTYSNSCFACQDEKVLFYTEGVCPE